MKALAVITTASSARLMARPPDNGLRPSNVRVAVNKVMQALRAEAKRRASGAPPDVMSDAAEQVSRDRMYNDGRLPLEMNIRVKEMMPGHIMSNVMTRTAVEAISSGSDDPVAAVEAFGD